MKLVVALLLSTTACAPEHQQVVSVPVPFQQIYADFLNDSVMAGHFQNIDDLIIQFSSDLPGEWAGDCVNQGGLFGTPTININAEYWTQISNDQREELVYHEMGHCVLDRGHTSARWEGQPDSIMNPQVFPTGLFSQYREHYVLELFGDIR